MTYSSLYPAMICDLVYEYLKSEHKVTVYNLGREY